MNQPRECSWSGVFPAATTQFTADLTLDAQATCAVQAALVAQAHEPEVEQRQAGESAPLAERARELDVEKIFLTTGSTRLRGGAPRRP